MSVSGFARFLTAPIVVWFALQGGVAVYAQDIEPVNSGANPYRKILNWGIEPEGRPWGSANGVAIDRDGKSVWTADRCGTLTSCVGSKVDPIQKFDENGKLLKVNLIVSTGHNNWAMSNAVDSVAKTYVKGPDIHEGMLNRVEAAIRAYDPCLSCSTHAVGQMPIQLDILGPDGSLVKTLKRD